MHMKIKPGGALRRLCAYLLDIAFCFTVGFALTFLYFKIFTNVNLDDFFNLSTCSAIAGRLVALIGLPLYFLLFECSKWQATPGKKLLKLKVINFDGSRLSLWRSCVRVFFYTLIPNIQLILAHYIYSTQTNSIIYSFKKLQTIKSLIPSNFDTPQALLTEIRAMHEATGTIMAQFAMVPGHMILGFIGVIWFATILFTENKIGIYEFLSQTKVICITKPSKWRLFKTWG